MRIRIALLILVFCFAFTQVVFADPFDTKHRIHFGPGFHAFWQDDEQEGTRPNQDGVVSDEEWQYIFDEGYDISDYNGLTFEVGYEYQFVHWFGLATTLGWYGGNNKYSFRIEGIKVDSDLQITVFHVDVMPRFHWQTRWTDLYGGPVAGLYNGKATFEIDVELENQNVSFSDSDTDSDTGLGWGLSLGFEFRISEHWGVALEGRSTFARLFTEKEKANDWFNAGGNVMLLMCAAHF